MAITATRTTSLFPGGDVDGDGQFDPGDIVITRIRITNSGPGTITGITVSDTVAGSNLDGSSVQISPIAYDDSFTITGNTPITLLGSQLTGNDDDPDGLESALHVTKINGVSVVAANGITPISVTVAVTNGSVTSNLDGTFTFTPNTGLDVNATASFNYSVGDAQGLNSVETTPGIATFTITDVVWYVDNTASAVGADGSYLHPFTSLSQLNDNGTGAGGTVGPNDGIVGDDDVDSAGETVFVYHNGGNYTAGISLEAGQKLIGDGQAFMANGHNIGGAERTGGADVLTNAVVSQASGIILTLGTDNTVKGLTFDANGAGAVGMADGNSSVSATGTLLVSGVSFTGTGQAVDIDQGGNLNVTIDSLTSTGSSNQGVQLAGTASSGTSLISGSFTVTGGNIQGATSHDFLIGGAGPNSGGTVAVTYGGTLGSSTGGSAVNINDRIAGAGDINFTGNITQSSGLVSTAAGIALSNIAAGTINFTGTKTLGSTAGVQSAISVAGNSGGTVNFSGGAIDIDFSTGTNGSGLSVTNMTGGSVNVSTAADIDFAGSANGRGINISASTGGSVNFTGGNLTIDTRDGTALFDNNAAAGSSLNISGSGNTLASSNGGALIDISNVATTGITFNTLNAAASVINNNGVRINNLDGGTFTTTSITVAGTSGATSDGVRIEGGSSTNFSLGTVSVVNTGDDGIELNGANGTVSMSSLNVQNTTGQGVEINSATNSVTITAGTIGNTNDPTAEAVLISGGTGAVTVGASVTKSTAGNVVEIATHATGAVNFSGAISATGAVDNGILITNSSGAINFTGNVTLSTGAGNAFSMTNSAGTGGPAVSLVGGNLDIDTTTGTGINATNANTGASSLTISGATNANAVIGSVASVGGRAINIDGVTANVTLRDVSANGGGSTGVFLKNTGGGGQFVITGTGTTIGSGGTIQQITGADASGSTTGTGMYLENVSNVSLTNMIFGSSAVGALMSNFGIRGENVNNFTLRDSEFRGNFGTSAAFDEGAIRFGTENNVGTSGLKGTALFEGNVIGGGYENNLSVFLYSNDTLVMTVKDNATSGKAAVFNVNQTAQGDDSLHVESGGTGSNLTLTVTGVDFNGARADQLDVLQIGQTTQNLTITNNNFLNGHTNIVSGGGGVRLLSGDTAASSNVNVTYNFTGNTIRGAVGDAFRAIYTGTAGTISGLILNNTIGTNGGGLQGGTAAGSSGGGSGIDVGAVRSAGTGSLTYAVRIEGNSIRDIANAFGGIILTANMAGTTGTSRFEATIKNNSVQEVGTDVLAGLYAIVGGQSSAAISNDAAKMGLIMSGNTFTAGTNGGGAIFLDQLSGNAQYYLPGYTVNANSSHGEFRPSGGGGTASTSLDTFLDANNNLISGAFTFPAGSDVSADQTTNIGNQAFVLAVPIMAAVPEGLGWEDLIEKPVNDPNVDTGAETGSGTPDTSGGGTGTGTGGGTGSGGTGETGTPPPPPPPPAAPTTPVVNDGILSNAELGFLVEAAIQRWIDAGASPAQIEAMRAVQFGIVDMSGIYVGSSTHGVINIDDNAAGYGWFVDVTPGEDSEYEGSGTRLTADAGGAAAGKLDLLTVLMHELGHQIGLGDEYLTSHTSSLMYGYINVGERRLPANGEAAGAQPGSVGATAFALAPVPVGTLPANKAVDVFFKSTITDQFDNFIVNPSNTATIKYDGSLVDVLATEQITLDSLTLGNLVWKDVNADGDYDPGTDTGIQNVVVELYADTNNSGSWDGGDALLGNRTTDANGLYSFAGLAPGDYIVLVKASNFNSGGPLENLLIAHNVVTDPDDNIENDNNGIAAGGGAVASQTITLNYNTEPTNGVGNDINNSLDFGFVANQPPVAVDDPGLTATEDQDSQYSTQLTGNDTDVDFDTLTITAANNATHGTVSVAAGVVTFHPDANYNGTATFEYTISDGNGHTDVGLATITVGAVNDPVTTSAPLTQTLNEDSSNVAVTGLSIADVDAALAPAGVYEVTLSATHGALTLTTLSGLTFTTGNGTGNTTMTFHGTLADINTALATAKYTPDLNYAGSAQIQLQATDTFSGTVATGTGLATSDSDTIAVTVDQVNDPPVGAPEDSDAIAGTPYVFLVSDFTFSDPVENNAFAGVKISSLPGAGTLKLNGGNVSMGDIITLAQLTAGQFTFESTVGMAGTSTDFTFQVQDNGGIANGGLDLDQTPRLYTMNVGSADAAPVVDLNGADGGGNDFASAFTEGGAAAAIADTDVLVTDADAGDDIVSATITITNAAAGDLLTVALPLPGALVIDGSSTATSVKITGSGTPAEYQDALKLITFSNTGENPTAGGTNLARTISVTVNDGVKSSTAAIATVAVTGINDAPTAASNTISAVEDTFRVLTATDLGFVDVDGTLGSVAISAVTGGKIYFDADGAGGADPVEQGLPHTFTGLEISDGKVSFKADPNANGPGTGMVSFTVKDNEGADGPSAYTLTIDVTAVNDAPVAQPDDVSTPEDTIGAGNLFDDNGFGVDSDVEGDLLTISEVNGSTLNVGVVLTLASGAELKVNSDGSYTYDPKGKFNSLTDNTSGAVNTSATETFKYRLSGGNEVTVTVTIDGVAGPGDLLFGSAADNTITGTPEVDDFRLQQGGNDTVYGLASDDIFYFGNAFTGADTVDGDDGRDVVILQGNYNLILSATTLTDVESISLQSGSRTKWGDTANNLYDYNITTNNANVLPGNQLIVNGQSLHVGEDFTFDGSAETDGGSFLIFGGQGVDTLKGSAGNDVFVFNGDRWGASDSVDGGPGSKDALIISAGNGLTHITFGATSLTGIEAISVNNRYAIDVTAKPSYEFVLHNGNVAAGGTLVVNGSSLDPTQTFSVDGTTVAAGKFLILFGGAAVDVLKGGLSNDTIIGGLGSDMMTGGGGNDVFRYMTANDSTTAANDSIEDFNLGDILDLSAVDANSTLDGDQAFTFIGNGPFTNQAGQLQAIHSGGGVWVVSGDVDGVGGADFQFTVTVTDNAVHPLTVADFVL